MDTPVEITTRYATIVNNLTTAWAFVMEHIDTVGPHPSVTINPIYMVDDDTTAFEIAVSGTIERSRN